MIKRAPSTLSDTIIELRNVTLDYGSLNVVQDVNLRVKRGETKVILGPSGVGKSTILKAILGLLKPSSGQIFVHDWEISTLSETQMVPARLNMAMVFQNGALFDSMTVFDNVSYRLREFSMGGASEIRDRVFEALDFVGLKGAIKLYPAQLSGGMRKRVAIARALASNPDIFLFDEPTVGLDPVNYYNVEKLIARLKKKVHRSIIIVTHHVTSAMRLADSIVMLYNQQFIFEGTPEDLRNIEDPRVKTFLHPSSQSPIQENL